MVTPNWSDFKIRKTTADADFKGLLRSFCEYADEFCEDADEDADGDFKGLLDIGAELKKRPAAAPKAATALAAAPKAAAAAPAAAPKAAPKAGPKAAAAPADGRPPLEAMGLGASPKLKQATSKITFFFARADEFFSAHVDEQLCYLLMWMSR